MQQKQFSFCYLLVACTFMSACDPALFSPSYNATLHWTHPTSRENGFYLRPYDIGGYEIRYHAKGSDQQVSIVIEDPSAQQYTFDNIDPSNTVFEIAIFDTEGNYSDFVVAAYR